MYNINKPMILTEHMINILLHADGKALATMAGGNINVVPVSSIKVVGNKIWLINYFLGKTHQNIINNSDVALACWKGLEGYQIKGDAVCLTEGGLFDEAKLWIEKILPERVVKGLLIITPREIFDVSASKDRAGKKVL